ncbi:unnamed protein product [Cyprideis torosa]|uniref:Uncharacterized protein n=1 Tax=Cyprideis torosa TaxID=163714 RepID=A0A7R8WLI4_9CRUS|nr:unnamed protein product [Cyprideis torosa]CAG0897291.1 unnamed protein product [Cyprideis torosa]
MSFRASLLLLLIVFYAAEAGRQKRTSLQAMSDEKVEQLLHVLNKVIGKADRRSYYLLLRSIFDTDPFFHPSWNRPSMRK